jgi:cytochrome o ubiquinol oxidase subunit 2
MYAMSGMATELYAKANSTGIYRGASANISGRGFAGMTFSAESMSGDAYAQWIQKVIEESTILDTEEFKRVSVPSENNKEQTFKLAYDSLFQDVLAKYTSPGSYTGVDEFHLHKKKEQK